MAKVIGKLERIGVSPYEPDERLIAAITAFQKIVLRICPRAKIEVAQTSRDVSIRIRAPLRGTPMFDVHQFFVWSDENGEPTGLMVQEYNPN